jgi:hypothetical protein
MHRRRPQRHTRHTCASPAAPLRAAVLPVLPVHPQPQCHLLQCASGVRRQARAHAHALGGGRQGRLGLRRACECSTHAGCARCVMRAARVPWMRAALHVNCHHPCALTVGCVSGCCGCCVAQSARRAQHEWLSVPTPPVCCKQHAHQQPQHSPGPWRLHRGCPASCHTANLRWLHAQQRRVQQQAHAVGS